MKPNLFIVGAARAGTTSLYHYLKQHPDIYMSPVKEPHFFSRVVPDAQHRTFVRVVSDEDAYHDLFRGVTTEKIIGEASTSYLWDNKAPERIKEYVPGAKIIISLRDPIDRAYSHYLLDVREGRQRLPFFEALKEDYARDRKGWGISHLYVELGLYCEQVSRYLQRFDKGNVLILFFEEFVADIPSTLKRIADFLGVDASALADFQFETKHNPYAAPRSALSQSLLGTPELHTIGRLLLPRSVKLFLRNRILLRQADKPQIEPQAFELLQKVYAPEMIRLEEILQRNLPWKPSGWTTRLKE